MDADCLLGLALLGFFVVILLQQCQIVTLQERVHGIEEEKKLQGDNLSS